MKKVEISVYEFDELDEEVQRTVIEAYVNFLLEIVEASGEGVIPKVDAAIEKAERLRTPWFTQQIIFENMESEIKQEVRKYYYFSNGRIHSKMENYIVE